MPRDNFDVDAFINDSLDLDANDGADITQSDVDAAASRADNELMRPQQQQTDERNEFDKSVDDFIRDSMGEAKQNQEKKADDKTQQTQQTQHDQQQKQDRGLRPLAGRSNQFVDGEGNIVDVNGNIIAAKGMQRRLHQENERMREDVGRYRTENENLLNKFQEMQGVVDSMREAGEIFRSQGVTPDEMKDAAQIIATFKANPVAAAREVVARAMALGHNITDIVGDEVGNSIDMQALDRMIQQRIGATGNQPAQAGGGQPASSNDPIAHQYNTFITRYPEAKLHEDDIVYLMQKNPSWDMYQAYDALRSFADSNNLDLTRPLKPQVDAIIQQQQQQGNQPPARQQQKPLMPGRGSNAAQQAGAKKMTPQTAGADDSWSSILGETFSELKQSGINF